MVFNSLSYLQITKKMLKKNLDSGKIQQPENGTMKWIRKWMSRDTLSPSLHVNLNQLLLRYYFLFYLNILNVKFWGFQSGKISHSPCWSLLPLWPKYQYFVQKFITICYNQTVPLLRKVWYHKIWIQNKLGFMVLLLAYSVKYQQFVH